MGSCDAQGHERAADARPQEFSNLHTPCKRSRLALDPALLDYFAAREPNSPPMDDHITKERISLLCPVSHARMQRPSRSARCLHATAFCAAALPALKAGGTGLYRCPSCSITFTADELVADVPLTLFLSEHPEATSCAVVRRSAVQGGWAYRGASSKAPKPPKAQHRSRTPSQLKREPSEASEASSSDAMPRRVKTDVKSEPGEAATLLEKAVHTQPQRGGAAARVAAQVAQHAAIHAAAPPCGARAPTAASSASAQRPPPAAHWARGAAAAHVQVQAAAARAAALRSGAGGSSTARPAVVAPGQPQKQSQEERAARRLKRREDAKRAQLLARVKEVLIRRALHEEQPPGSGAGTCLWGEDSD